MQPRATLFSKQSRDGTQAAMDDATTLSQRVNAVRSAIQLLGKPVAMEPFVHRQSVIKRENIGFPRTGFAMKRNSVSFIA
jgi:hypothetical protein